MDNTFATIRTKRNARTHACHRQTLYLKALFPYLIGCSIGGMSSIQDEMVCSASMSAWHRSDTLMSALSALPLHASFSAHTKSCTCKNQLDCNKRIHARWFGLGEQTFTFRSRLATVGGSCALCLAVTQPVCEHVSGLIFRSSF